MEEILHDEKEKGIWAERNSVAFFFIDLIADKATFGHLTNEKLEALEFIMPPEDEARKIVDYIDEKIKPFAVGIAQINKSIETICNYRTRLITDVVTGAVDVSNVHVPEVEEVAAALAGEAEAEEEQEPIE